MLEIIEQLLGIGEEMKDNHVVAFLLSRFSESCGAPINALEIRPEPELEYVKSKLIDEHNFKQ